MNSDRTIEQRLAALEAVEAIKQLKYRYFHACDQKDVQTIRECFADGEIDLRYGRIGNFTHRDQLLQIFEELACQPHIVEMHHGQNPQVTVHSPERATALWGLYYYLIDTRRNRVTQLAGSYDDAYRLETGQWRMVQSHYTVSATQIFDLNEGLARVIFAGAEAPVSLDDPADQAG